MRARERYTITAFTNPSGEKVWRVQGRTPDGKRFRENRQTFEEAVARKAELEIQALNLPVHDGLKRTRLTDQQLAEAEAAVLKLNGTPLLNAVDFYLANYRPPATRKTVQEAYDEFIAAQSEGKKKLRDRTLSDYASRLKSLRTLYGNRSVADLTVADVEPLIFKEGQSAYTANGNRCVLYAFFGWCQKPRNKYIQVNPIGEIEPAETDEIDPEVMTFLEVKALLKAAMQFKDGVMLPYFALAFFAGLRPKELARLSWKHVNLNEGVVRLGSDVAKLRQRRTIELESNAIEWLRRCFGKPIVGKNWRRDFDAVRRMAGFRGCVSRKDQNENLKEWPQDVLRHTALSNHYAKHKDERDTAGWAGNKPDTLHRYYKGLVTEAEAGQFWELRPDNIDQAVPVRVAA
jgi:integrase